MVQTSILNTGVPLFVSIRVRSWFKFSGLRAFMAGAMADHEILRVKKPSNILFLP
jgi:hypothetical protein